MRHLLKITFIVALVISALITFAKVAKSSNSAVDFLFADKTGSLCPAPCLLGIQPGEPAAAAFDQTANNPAMNHVIPLDNSNVTVSFHTLFGIVYFDRDTRTPTIDSKIYSAKIDFRARLKIKKGQDVLTNGR